MKAAALLSLAAAASACQALPASSSPPAPLDLQAVERSSGARLGVALVGSNGEVLASNRAGERFAFCSTFKLLLAGMVLQGKGTGLWSLEDRLPVTERDVVFHSPEVEQRVGTGWISVGDAARAAVVVGDNAAANLLVRKVGGIVAFNGWLRRHGDHVSRLDRPEPMLNDNQAGDPRDTTTPEQMARNSASLVFGDWLKPEERARLRDWLVESETGRDRVRAAFPKGWRAGDKTGTCGAENRESYNDVAFILPDPSAPKGYMLAVYLDRPKVDAKGADRAIAEVGRLSSETIKSER